MGVIGEAFGGAIDTTIDAIMKGIDELVTSDEERDALKKQVIEAQLNSKTEMVELANEYENNVTKRWVADSDSASWLAKAVRPLALIFMYITFTLVVVMDSMASFNFAVGSEYIEIYKVMLITITVGYFGSRGVEKVSAIYKGRRVNGVSNETLDMY